MIKTRPWDWLALLQVIVGFSAAVESYDTDLLKCTYHYLVPDEPPLTGVISSYNYPFNYQNKLSCEYTIHLPVHLTGDYQICFKFLRFDLEDCYDKLVIQGETFCGKGRLDHNSPKIPTKSIWTEPLCYKIDKSIQLKFDSDSRDVRRGFYAEYDVFLANPDSPGSGPEQQETNTSEENEEKSDSCSLDVNTFRCFDRSCTPVNTTCDGVWNCPDYSDETYMHAGCNASNEIPAREGWICGFDGGEACGNFISEGWRLFSPKLHRLDGEYEPEEDHTTGRDHGRFITTDFGSQTSGVATLKFPITLGDEYYCLSFWYQMRGELVGRLDVHWGTSTDGMPVWTRNGTTGYRWQRAQIPIYRPKIKQSKIVFKATRHSSARSRISIDDFALMTGKCEFLDDISCNFETDSLGPLSGPCGWELQDDAYNWNNVSSNWQIIEASKIDDYSIYHDRSPDNNVLRYTVNLEKPAAAFLRSPVVSQAFRDATTQKKCFTFWYYSTSAKLSIKMYANYGKGMSWTSIPFYVYDVKETEIWRWKQMKVDLPNNNRAFRVLLMVAYNRFDFAQTIAFDEFALVGESCSYLETLACPPGYFACKNGMCIQERDRCNGNPDCKDHSDESKAYAGCDYDENCKTTDFRCVTKMNVCMPYSWVCDGTQDCDDRSDERNCHVGSVVPPAAIGAICAAAAIVIGFILFKLAYGVWKKRHDDRPYFSSGGSAHELPDRRDQQLDLGAFEPPPTYAQCVNNPAYMPEDAFKPPEAPGSSNPVAGDNDHPSAGTTSPAQSHPPPPSYDRILSGEFKELTAAQQRKVSRGQSVSAEFSVSDIPSELRPNRPRSAALNDPDPTISSYHHNSPASVFMTPSSQNLSHVNVAFTQDEFSEILSAMQSRNPTPDTNSPVANPILVENPYNRTQRSGNLTTGYHDGAYSNSGFQDNESDDICYDEAVYDSVSIDRSSTAAPETVHISQINEISESSI